jgi:hypothetical protein
VLNRGWKRDSPNNDIRICLLDMRLSSTKNAFWDVNSKKCRKWCKFFSPLLCNNTQCSQWTSSVQIKYFMFDWSIYRLIVLNRAWKRDSLEIMSFVCSLDMGAVDLKTRFESWIKRNEVYGVRFLHFSYLITLMAYLCSQ